MGSTNKQTKNSKSAANNSNAQNQQQTLESQFQEFKKVLLQDAEEGKKQLIHELTHLVIQSGGQVSTSPVELFIHKNGRVVGTQVKIIVLYVEEQNGLFAEVHDASESYDKSCPDIKIEQFSYDELVSVIKGLQEPTTEEEDDDDDDGTHDLLEALGIDVKINGKKASTEDVLTIIAKLLGK